MLLPCVFWLSFAEHMNMFSWFYSVSSCGGPQGVCIPSFSRCTYLPPEAFIPTSSSQKCEVHKASSSPLSKLLKAHYRSTGLSH